MEDGGRVLTGALVATLSFILIAKAPYYSLGLITPILVLYGVMYILEVVIVAFISRDYKQTEQAYRLRAKQATHMAIENAKLYEEARNAVKVRDEFMSIASHELKTPITSMLLQLQSVLHSIKNEPLANFSVEKMMRMLETTEVQSKRLTKLVNDLSNVSMITTGRIALEKEEADIVELVRDVTNRFEQQIKDQGITMQVDAKGPIKVEVDKLRIEQVITNLITNAIKYGNGSPVHVAVKKQGSHALITVEDHGIGIPPDKLDEVFGRFKRAVTNKQYQGLGVGLFISRQIVHAHGGQIHVKSHLNEGSIFTVELPIK